MIACYRGRRKRPVLLTPCWRTAFAATNTPEWYRKMWFSCGFRGVKRVGFGLWRMVEL